MEVSVGYNFGTLSRCKRVRAWPALHAVFSGDPYRVDVVV